MKATPTMIITVQLYVLCSISTLMEHSMAAYIWGVYACSHYLFRHPEITLPHLLLVPLLLLQQIVDSSNRVALRSYRQQSSNVPHFQSRQKHGLTPWSHNNCHIPGGNMYPRSADIGITVPQITITTRWSSISWHSRNQASRLGGMTLASSKVYNR